jgi:hypothetical protein
MLKEMPKKECIVCHKIYEKPYKQCYEQWNNQIYCSRRCKADGMMIGKRSFAWKGGFYISGGYRYILKKDHPQANEDGYVREHRYIM